jgi:hypothetical protein
VHTQSESVPFPVVDQVGVHRAPKPHRDAMQFVEYRGVHGETGGFR